MSINFYKKNKTNQESLLKLSDEVYNILEGSFDKFEKKTGIFIDPYGKTWLYPDNLRLLSEIIRDDFSQTNGGCKNDEIEMILKKFNSLYQADEIIEALGD